MNHRLELFLLIIIFAVATFVRFYNFEQRINFGPEQAISLITSGNYIKNGFSLLGQPYYHNTSTGLTMFYGPQFNYLLVPIMVAARYNPIAITAFFSALYLITGLVIYLLSKKLTNAWTALIALVLFLFNSLMINYSLFIWCLHFFPIMGFVSFYLVCVYKKNKYPLLITIILGAISGFGISLEYPYAVFSLIIFLWLLVKSDKKIITFLMYVVGNIIGNLPMVMFELRHDIYNLRVLYQYSLDQAANRTHTLDIFHFLPIWGIGCFFVAIIIYQVFKKRWSMPIILFAYIILNLKSPLIDFDRAIGMPNNMNMDKLISASKSIANDQPSNFNLVSLIDFDTRAHPLRYLTSYIYGHDPMGVEAYPQAKTIYVLADKKYPINDPMVWELKSFLPYETNILKEIDDNNVIYKLTK